MQDPFDSALALTHTASRRSAKAPDELSEHPSCGVRPTGVACDITAVSSQEAGGAAEEVGTRAWSGPSSSRAGEFGDAVEEVGDGGAVLVGSQLLDGCVQAVVGSGGREGGVDVEKGVPVGEGGIEVAEA